MHPIKIGPGFNSFPPFFLLDRFTSIVRTMPTIPARIIAAPMIVNNSFKASFSLISFSLIMIVHIA